MKRDRLRVLFCDHLNLARGKYLPGTHEAGGETRFCRGVYALTYDKELLPAPGSEMLTGLPDMIARFDGDEIRPGWCDGDQVVVADQFDSDGEVLPMCGRGLLKRTVAAWNELGYQPKVGIELEAYAFARDDGGNGGGTWQPLDTPGAFVYGTGPFTDPHGFIDAIWQAADACGFPLEMVCSEFDAPQFEFTLRFDDAVKAADDAFLFRQLAREVALQNGLLLTFMPKPIAELSGSGVHVNFSLWSQAERSAGQNAIGDAEADDRLSDLGRACVAGLMHHHRALAAVLAPCVNSYQRLQPATLSGYWRNWGRDHRGVTTRITSETGKHARVEHRMADGAANPYTMIAAVLQAARLGVVNEYELPPAETADCLENHDAEDGVPADLASAFAEMQNDAELRAAVGDGLVANLAAIKEHEIAKTAEMDAAALRDYYIHYI